MHLPNLPKTLWLAAILSTVTISYAVTDLELCKGPTVLPSDIINITEPGTYRLHGYQDGFWVDWPVTVAATGRVNLILDSAFVNNSEAVRMPALETSGEVHLYLKGKNELKGYDAGIACTGRLYIHDYVAETGDDGQVGALSAIAFSDGDGIGGKVSKQGCAITIDGGDITATSESNSGIGGSSFTMTGAKVYAYSDGWAGVKADTVLVSGGILEAVSDSWGAGISVTGGSYTQTGGLVTAKADGAGAGIGGSSEQCMGHVYLQGGHLRTPTIGNGIPSVLTPQSCPNNSMVVRGGSIEWIKDDYSSQGVFPRTNGIDSLYALVLYGLPGDAPVENLSLSSFPTYKYNDSRVGLDGHLTLFVPAGNLKGKVVVDGRTFAFDTTVKAKDSTLVDLGTTVKANLLLNNGDWHDWTDYGLDLRWVYKDQSVKVPANGFTSLDSGTWKLSANDMYLGKLIVDRPNDWVKSLNVFFYMVQFKVKKVSVYKEIVLKKSMVKLPAASDLPCTVMGWYTDTSYTNAWKADSSVSTWLTLYGKPGADCPETITLPEFGLFPIIAPKVDYIIPAPIQPALRQRSNIGTWLGHRFDLLGRLK